MTSPRDWIALALLVVAPGWAVAQPKLVELKVEPPALSLSGPRDARRFVVSGKTEDGSYIDVTRQAKVLVQGDGVRLQQGFVEPVKDGAAALRIEVGALQATLPVMVSNTAGATPVSFVRDIMPILAKAGCNAGTCHGAQKGRNGFKLSLRGYDPAFDYEQIVEEIAGRRIDRNIAVNSLVLLKPTQGVPHEGGFLFPENSRYYTLMRQWIDAGCQSDAEATKRVDRLEVLPKNPVLPAVGFEQQLVVLAYFADGTSRDVTRDAIYTSSSDSVASVSADGLVKGIRKGETAILIRYEGQFGVNPVSVLAPNPGYQWPNPPANNYVDELVYKKLRRIKVTPSELCTDSDFLRRIYLDLIGIPPTPEEIRAFLADARDTKVKRAEVIDKLLERPEYVDFWTLRWADLMQVNRKYLGEKGAWSFHQWIRQQVTTDRAWNEMAHDLLTGVGTTADSPPSAFFRIAREPGQAVENATHLFLGIRFNCNKCHDHPFERWTWNQYYEMAAWFSQAGIQNRVMEGDELVYERREGGEVRHPKTNQTVPPKFPFEVAGLNLSAEARRQQLAKWMTSADNPYFAKAMSNRLWSYLTGRGIIDPVDDIRAGNPPSNPELLDALTADFIKHRFSMKHMLRVIANSRTYQLSIEPNASNQDDQENFSRARPRRLTAEQLLDSVRLATATQNKFAGLPAGFRAAQLPDPSVGRGSMLEQFGQPIRESPCECERRNEMSLNQALALVNGPTLSDSVSAPGGRITQLFQTKPDDKKLVEEIFLAVLCRTPTAMETKRFTQVLEKSTNKQETAQDIMWALLNSSAFLFNR